MTPKYLYKCIGNDRDNDHEKHEKDPHTGPLRHEQCVGLVWRHASRRAFPFLADSAPGKRSLALGTRDACRRARSRRVLAKVAGSAHLGACCRCVVVQRTIGARQLRVFRGVLAHSTRGAGSRTHRLAGFTGRTCGALSVGG